MYVIEFSLRLGKVDVGAYLRNGKLVRGFSQKRLLSAREVAEQVAANQGNVQGIAKTLADPTKVGTRSKELKTLGLGFLSAVKNPSKAIKEGFERERLLLEGISAQTGRKVSKGEVVSSGLSLGKSSIKKIVNDPNQRKELVVNLGGFVASKGGSLTGIPGMGLAGDYVGARTTRRAFDDTKILKNVMSKLQGDNAYNEANRLGKISQIFKESKIAKRANKEIDRQNRIGDISGWAVGNFAAGSTAAIIPVPLTGAIPGAIAANLGEAVAKISPPKSYSEAVSSIISNRIKQGDLKEKALRDSIRNNWESIKQLQNLEINYGQ